MADIELIIKINEKQYEHIKNVGALWIEKEGLPIITKALLNGTLLPKGHKKLIAEPTEEDIAKTVGGQNDFTECIKDAVKAVFDNADTIIEADKE